MKTNLKKLFALLLTLAMVLPMVAGIVPASAEEAAVEEVSTETGKVSATTASVDENALPTSIELGNIRVQLLSERLVRIEVKGPKGFEDRASFTVQNRQDWDAVSYTSETVDGFTVIATSAYKVYIPQDAQTPDGCYVTDLEGNTLWNYETNTNSNVYLPSPSDELNSWYFADSPRVIPSENGYGVVENYEENNGWDLSNDATDLFVFLPQGSYENFTSDFVALTGSSEMLTLKMLGFWDSRWYAYNEETALQQIRDYQDRGYPIDMLVIDTDWRATSASGIGYDINTELFPDMAGFLEKAHEMGVSIMFNDHPEPATGTTGLLDEDEIKYRNEKLKYILSLGMDTWWYDRNWHTALNPIHDDLSIYTTGQYAFQWITQDYYESIAGEGEYPRRALIMANVDGIKHGVLEYAPELASHRYSFQWTGDILSETVDLEYEIFNAIYGGAELGLPYVSADIGGHCKEVSNDMYVRWIQFGALSPIMRVHCTKPYSRMPWLYGETAEAVTHTYVDMRYRLLPIYYALAHENYETGLPMLRRLDINYPQYAEAANNYQFLLGDTVLVAPLAEGYATTDDFTLEADGQAGLKAEYFNNKDLSGSPVVTQYDQQVNFDWGQNGPDGLGVSDNFSVRWTGNITIGEEDARIRLYADDGVRVWIDDELVIDGWTVYDRSLHSDVLKAGSTHAIKIEYFDSGYNAHIYMSVVTNAGIDHEVFLPEGEWMDVWTGKTYAGPATVTVNHKLETSPIFVRMGAALTLADNMTNVDEKDWSHMTLDVYPSISHGTTTTLYEDDTTTVGYKSGQFRTTDITLSGKDKTVDLLIAPAQGSFTGDRACTERNWTVRVHGRDDWGELTGMTLNGEAVDFTVVAKDASAQPLAIVGGCRDNVVYEVSFHAAVTDESKLSFTFENTCADDVNVEYDDTAASFTASVESLKKDEVDLNLTAIGNKDWALFGAVNPNTVYRKNVDNHLIGDLTGIGTNFAFGDNYPIAWQDGDLSKAGSTTNGPVSNHSFELNLKADKDTTHYEIYLGGYQSVAKLTIRDRAGNVKTYTFGDLDTNFYRKVVIDVTAEEASEIYICYSLLSGNNITFSAVAASDGTVEDLNPDDTGVNVNIATPYTTTLDLTAEGDLYWEYYGQLNQSGGSQQDCKANAADIIDTSFDNSRTHWDNKAAVTWSDGMGTASATTYHGLNSDSQTVTVNTEGVTKVKLLVGAWNASNQMTVYDENGTLIDSQVVVSADSDARMALVSLDLSDYTGDKITVVFTRVDSNGGNVSLTAVTASGDSFTVDFNEPADSGLFDFYSSSNTDYVLSDNRLIANTTGELKAIYKDDSQPVRSVSVELYPDGETGMINGGLYINASEPGNNQDQINALYVGVESHFTGWDDAPNRVDLIIGSFPTWTEYTRFVTEGGKGNNLFTDGIKQPLLLQVDIYGNRIEVTLSLVSDPSKSASVTYVASDDVDLSLGKVGIRSQYSDVQFDNFTVVTDVLVEEDAVAMVGQQEFTSVTEAIAAANGQVVTILADTDEAITISADVTIDLAGKKLSKVNVESGNLQLIDTVGGGSAAVEGAVDNFTEADSKTYLVVGENGVYSAHEYSVAITHISLNPSKDALGYKAQLLGDEVVQAHVKSFGFNLWVDGGKVKTYGKTGTDVVSLRLNNILKNNGGEMNINATAFVTLAVGEETHTETGSRQTTTMKETLQLVDSAWDTYTETQKAAVRALVNEYSNITDEWELDNIQPTIEIPIA